ncbi:MAG: AI-2E family transporter [Clostridia bacterium]|nr:AI-2E family transporter [Clostridia bacterium]
MNRKLRHWLWYFSLPAAAILLYKLWDNFSQAIGLVGTLISILAPFVGGFVLAFFLYAPCNWLEGKLLRLKGKAWKKLARPLSLTVVYLALLGIVALLVYLILPLVVSSITSLVNTMPDYLRTTTQRINEFISGNKFLAQFELADKLTDVYQYLLEALTKLLTTENILTAIKGVGSVASSLLNVLIAFIVSVYMLSGRESLFRALRAVCGLFIKPAPLTTIRRYTVQIGHIFSNYFYGAFIDALAVGVVVSIGLLIFRVPYALLLGMAMGLLNMIPYFGAIIGGVGVALITLLTTNIYTTIAVVIYMVVVQQVDANIIQPRIVGGSVGLRPIYVLLAITLFGGLFGFWGIFLGVPLMAVVQLFVKAAIARKEQRNKKPDDSPSETAE